MASYGVAPMGDDEANMKTDDDADVVSRRAASIVIVISNSLVSFAFQLSPSVGVTEVPGCGRAGASLRSVSRQPQSWPGPSTCEVVEGCQPPHTNKTHSIVLKLKCESVLSDKI